MRIEKLGEVFINGEIINLDNSSIDELNQSLKKVKDEKEKVINSINVLLQEAQK